MKKVLVAEDESSIREFVVINLKRNGYDVVEAADGAQAIEKYKACNGDIDVAILDIMMPYVDGLEVCKQLRAMNANLGIIMLTAKTQEMDKVSGLLIGADDYVTKPFSPSELMARVDVLYRRVEMSAGFADSSHANVITSGEFELNMRDTYQERHPDRTHAGRVPDNGILFHKPGRGAFENGYSRKSLGQRLLRRREDS